MDIFLFLFGYVIQLLASAILALKISSSKSIYGLSVDTQLAFVLANISRCIWVLETRLVETSIAYLELIASTGVSLYLAYLCVVKHHDPMNVLPPSYLSWPSLAGVSLVVAFLFNPGSSWFSFQILVAFTIYLEALALLPQLHCMRRTHFVEPLTSHYVALLIFARAVRMVFWAALWLLHGEHFFDLFLADLIHGVFAFDYLRLWWKKLQDGGKLVFNPQRMRQSDRDMGMGLMFGADGRDDGRAL